MTADRLVIRALILALAMPCGAAQYYLSPDGSDDAPGTRERPWQSIAKANAALQPGDEAIFLPGEYAGRIAPERSGSAGAPITYRSAEPRAARLVAGEFDALIVLFERAHIVIEDLYVDGGGRVPWIVVVGSHHLTLRGCVMRNGPSAMHWIRASSHIRLLDNVFNKDGLMGDTWHLEDCSQVLIEGNSFTRVGHCPLIVTNATDVVVRANVFHAEWGRNYSLWSSGRVLVEGNIITRGRDSAGSADSMAKNLYDDSIFRFNRVYDNLHTPLVTGSYVWQGLAPTGIHREPFRAVNSRFYHNTVTDNLGPAWSLWGLNVSANVFQNNIFAGNDWAGANVQLERGADINRDNRFVGNLMHGTQTGQTVVRYGDSYQTAAEADRGTGLVGGFWSEFLGTVDADPGFMDATNRDFRLEPGSAAIDAGRPLTIAIGAGTGRELPVADGRWFYDGFGIEGEQGDLIAVGQGGALARIERVELRYYRAALLHLDREVTWTDGMPVSLPWAGEAPDIGAYEAGGAHPTRLIALARPVQITPGQAVQFGLDTLGKDVTSVTWDFGDGSLAHEAETAHTYAAAGDYPVTVRATLADGGRGVDVAFVRVHEPVDPSAPLVMVDFEDATRGTEWGWHFKFYRGHQTGGAFVDRPDGQGKCAHLFRKEGQANQTGAQCAPGAWDIDRYPLVRFAYRIPEGVPVAVEVWQFPAPDRLGGFTLGGTPSRASRAPDLQACTLIDDGQWHEVTIDVRKAREIDPDLRYLRQFMFFLSWTDDHGQEMWFDDFAILPE